MCLHKKMSIFLKGKNRSSNNQQYSPQNLDPLLEITYEKKQKIVPHTHEENQ